MVTDLIYLALLVLLGCVLGRISKRPSRRCDEDKHMLDNAALARLFGRGGRKGK